MTAYAKAQVCLDKRGAFLMELISVNRKNLDLAVYCPKELTSLEIPFRKMISALIARGAVTLRITKASAGSKEPAILPEPEAFKYVYDHLVQCCNHAGLDASSIDAGVVTTVLAASGSLIEPVSVSQSKELITTLEKVLREFSQMSEQEGKHLEEAMLKTVDAIETQVAEIHAVRSRAPQEYKEKLIKRIEQLDHGLKEYEERIAKEVILFSEKVDIEEEVVRLNSHLAQFKQVLTGAADKKGKKLEFLAQEIHREVNTVASKSQDIDLIQKALEVKGLTKTLVEQLQNII